MDANSPWSRKIRRAEKHLQELELELSRWQNSHPYVLVRDRDTDPNPGIWTYRAKLVEEPQEDLGLIIGDFVHNLRSSLDHMVVALVPPKRKRSAKFPILNDDIWQTDPDTGEYIDRSKHTEDARSSYRSAVEGMPAEARRVVDMMQPFRAVVRRPWISQLNSLDIADKHHTLLAVTHGIENPTTRITSVAHNVDVGITGDGIALNGDVVASLPADLHALTQDHALIERVVAALASGDSEVNMKLTGTPKIGLEVPGVKGQFKIPETLDFLISQTWMLADMLGWNVSA